MLMIIFKQFSRVSMYRRSEMKRETEVALEWIEQLFCISEVQGKKM
jgi:hypothetical protein